MTDVSPKTGWEFGLRSDGKPVFHVINTRITNAIERRASTNVADGTWHHLVATYDGSSIAAGVRFFIDGRPDSATTTHDTLTASSVSTAALNIGSRDATAFWFNGTISDVSVYPRAMAGFDVAGHFSASLSHYPLAVQDDAAASYWRLAEKSGTTAADLGGAAPGTYSTTGVTLGQPGPLTGDNNTAVSFNGTTGTVTVSDTPSLRFDRTQPFSVETWVKSADTGGSYRALVSKISNVSPKRGWELGLGADGKPVFHLINTVSTNAIERHGSTNIADGGWHHLVATYDGSSQADGAQFFIDGQADGAPTTVLDSLTASSVSTTALNIGSRDSSARWFNGTLSNVAVYPRLLTSEQVAAHHTAGVTAPPGPNPVHRVEIEVQQFVAGGRLNVTTDVPGAGFGPNYGLLTLETDPDGKVTQTDYADAPNGIDPKFGLATAGIKDPSGLALRTATTYEAPGPNSYLRRVAKTLPAGNQTMYANYAGNEGPIAAVCGIGAGTPQGGLPKQRTDPAPASGSARVEQYVFDAIGRQVGRRLGTVVTISSVGWGCTSYDSQGRMTSQSWPAFGDQAARTATYTYGVGGNPLVNEVTDTNWPGQAISSTVDLLGRTVSYSDIWGNVTTTTYDQAGRVTDTSGPVGARHTDYDGAGRVSAQKLGGQTVAVPTYDAVTGRLQSVSYPSGSGNGGNGTSLTVAYDDNGRQNGLTFNAPGGGLLTSDQTVVSRGGRVESETIDDTLASSFTYDEVGRVTGATVPGDTLTFGYSSCATCAGRNSNRTTDTYSNAPAFYTYDAADRLKVSTDSRFAKPIYDDHGNTTAFGSVQLDRNIDRQFLTYDAADRHMRTDTEGSQPTTVTYRRDPLDRIVERNVATVGHRASAAANNGGLPPISFRSASNGGNGSLGSTTLSLSRPTNTLSGDLMLMHVSAGGGSGTTITPPPGWANVGETSNGASVKGATYYKVASSTDPSSYSIGFSAPVAAAGGIASYTGVDPNSPIDDSTEATATGTSLEVPGVTASVGGRVVGLFAANGGSVTPPPGMSQRWHRTTSSPVGIVSEVADEFRTTPGPTGSRTATTLIGGFWVGHLVALRPVEGPTSLTIAKPAGTIAGDLMLMHMSVGYSAQGVVPTVTPPAGWTEVKSTTNGPALQGITYRKFAGSSEPDAYTVSFSVPAPASGGIGSFTGVDTASPIEDSSEATATGSSLTLPSITASAGGRLVGTFAFLTVVGELPAWADPGVVTSPPSMRQRWRQSTVGPLVMTSAGADDAPTTTGSTGTRTATSANSGSWAGHFLALRPATPQLVTRYGFTGHEDAPALEQDGSGNVLNRIVTFAGGVVVTRAQATASQDDVWSYPNLHGDVQATADGSGTKTAGPFRYDPFGRPLTGYPSNTSTSVSYGWVGGKGKLTEHQGNIHTIEMGARQYLPGLGRFLSVDPVEGGCANDYTFAFGDPINHPDLDGLKAQNKCRPGEGPATRAAIGFRVLGVAVLTMFAVTGIGLVVGGAIAGATSLAAVPFGVKLGSIIAGAVVGAAAGHGVGKALCKGETPPEPLMP